MSNTLRSDKTRTLWFICPQFGVSSEVWMYRQATRSRHFDVQVITNERFNAEQYPISEQSIRIVPSSGNLPRSRFRRSWQLVKNYQYGFYPGTHSEILWWEKQFRQNSPDVILCQYGSTGNRIVPLANAFDVPVVVQFNGVDASAQLNQFGYRTRLKWALPKVAGCVIVAEYQRDRLVSFGARPERIQRIPYGVPIEEFSANGLDSKQNCRFLAVGRLVEKKAPQHTIRAFASCAHQVPNCELVILGDGPLLEQCQDLAQQLGASNRITFIGAQPIERVRFEMANADVFVQHSVTAPDGDMEGWPVSVAEACASGLPIVSTRHAGIVEQVRESESGYLVDEFDWEAMSECMVKLANDPALRVRMGAASRAHIAQFDVDKQIGLLEDFLLVCAKRAMT